MVNHDLDFDYGRYRRLLADAIDEQKRLALIDTLIQDRAMDMLAAARAAKLAELKANSMARVLQASARA